MNLLQRDVVELHRKWGLPVRSRPEMPDRKEAVLMTEIYDEENCELKQSIRTGDLVGIADGAVDVIVTVMGILNRCGIDIQGPWAVIQKSNMAKEPAEDGIGKIVKPAGWEPPDVRGALADQYRRGTLEEQVRRTFDSTKVR